MWILIFLWDLFYRLKIPFLMIFFLMTYNMLNEYMIEDQSLIVPLVMTFTIQNFVLHMLNNYFDKQEDELTNQSNVFTSPIKILLISAIFIVVSFAMVLYYNFSIACYLILFALMLLYSVPITKKFRIKKLLYVKNITGSLFWWYLPFVLIVALHTNNSFIDVFLDNLLILAIFIPFEPIWDIKDIKGDLAAGINTIPNKFGIAVTKLLVISLFIVIGVVVFKHKSMFVISFFLPLILMISFLNEDNKLWLSRLIILFLPIHIFLSNII